MLYNDSNISDPRVGGVRIGDRVRWTSAAGVSLCAGTSFLSLSVVTQYPSGMSAFWVKVEELERRR